MGDVQKHIVTPFYCIVGAVYPLACLRQFDQAANKRFFALSNFVLTLILNWLIGFPPHLSGLLSILIYTVSSLAPLFFVCYLLMLLTHRVHKIPLTWPASFLITSILTVPFVVGKLLLKLEVINLIALFYLWSAVMLFIILTKWKNTSPATSLRIITGLLIVLGLMFLVYYGFIGIPISSSPV